MNVQQCLTGIETPVGGFGKKKKESEVEKVKTFTQADFLGPKNLHEKCVIRDKFNATQSARFATNSIPKRLKNTVKQGNSVKHKETG